ncbi:MAG: hypothetical protein XD44_1081 [Methanobacteriaceae archaeon 41_258]|nr:MAG: hypothetical protein XD44_1081 [Methanobacteriaceae archaeon 41_258]
MCSTGNTSNFLSTKYGRKIELLKNNPYVAVEIEEFEPDLSSYKFVTLQGQIVQITDDEQKRVREMFVDMIREKTFLGMCLRLWVIHQRIPWHVLLKWRDPMSGNL